MCVDDPRASRTSFATSHLAVVYRGVPYDVLVMIDLHFFETKKSRARIRPVCPEGLCSDYEGTIGPYLYLQLYTYRFTFITHTALPGKCDVFVH